jgi:hypothetical protein
MKYTLSKEEMNFLLSKYKNSNLSNRQIQKKFKELKEQFEMTDFKSKYFKL